jgi:hypothetical protein
MKFDTAHKTQDEDKQNKQTLEKAEGAIKNGQARECSNIQLTRHRTKTENVATYSSQNYVFVQLSKIRLFYLKNLQLLNTLHYQFN